MLSFYQLKQYALKLLSFSDKEKEPADAYNLWSLSYDQQPDNLVLALDTTVFTELLKPISIAGKIIADIGCGTGRHWKHIIEQLPVKIIGFDVSEGMLEALRQKYPAAETHLLKNNFLKPLSNESCDIIISTLALAHIENMDEALHEWNRALKKGGKMVITDYHPAALLNGGNRTFRHKQKLIAVKNYIHTIDELRAVAQTLGWLEMAFSEKIIDDTIKHYYEKQHALAVFEKCKGSPIVYGIHFKKTE